MSLRVSSPRSLGLGGLLWLLRPAGASGSAASAFLLFLGWSGGFSAGRDAAASLWGGPAVLRGALSLASGALGGGGLLLFQRTPYTLEVRLNINVGVRLVLLSLAT